MNKRFSNIKQEMFAYEMEFKSGKEKGITGILVNNGELQAFFNESNALDISWVRYAGKNISFLSKNGLNTRRDEFVNNFEGGFLYTCGMDNVSTCVPGKPMHGSMHYIKAENVCIEQDEDKITVKGTVTDSELFGRNLCLSRCYEIYKDKIVINDEVKNLGYLKENYVLLYHTNFGYPFLDENLKIEMPVIKTDPSTDIAKKREDKKFIITSPVDGNPEDVYYQYLKKGDITLTNTKLNISVNFSYSVKDFPVTVQWKSMASGDYALGIEPSLTRFDDFKFNTLEGGESKKRKIAISFCRK